MDISNKAILENIKKVLKGYFPVSAAGKELVLEDIEADINKPDDPVTLLQIKDKGSSYTTPLYGIFSLKTDKGIVRKKVKLFSLPLATRFNTFIYDGLEYNISNQLRLRPGAYTRLRPDGQVETHMNFTTGWQFKIFFNEDKDIILQAGTRTFSLYSILKALDATDDEIRAIVGDEILEIMRSRTSADDPSELAYLISRGHSRDLKEVLKEFKVDPHITKLSIGAEFSEASKDFFLTALKDFIAIARGQKEPTNRDSYLFKEFRNAEDLFAERLEFVKPRLLAKIRRNLALKDDITEIVGTHIFAEPVRSMFSQLALVNYAKQTNPLRIINNSHRVTLLGEGGIQSEYAISLNARALDPAFLGTVDPLHLPQADAIGAIQFISVNARKEGNVLKGRFLDRTGNEHYLTPVEAYNKRIAFYDEIEYRDGKIKFKNPGAVNVQYRGKIITVPENEVDYIVAGPTSIFSYSSSMIPFLKHTHPARASMAATIMEQAVPLKEAEPPLVKTIDKLALKTNPDKLFTKKFNIYSPYSGKITRITDTHIYVNGKPVGIYHYYPVNEGYIHSNVRVKEGDHVEKGQLLADSNFTKGEDLALGKNLLAAFLPYKGLNFEDAIVISESAAKKLTSTHLYPFELDIRSNTVLSKRKYSLMYPGRFTPEELALLDEDGVIKEGTEVPHEGAPLIVALEEREITPQDASLMSISRSLYKPYNPVEITWPYDFKGTVKRVIKTPSRIVVYVYTEMPAQVGDKLINRFANKGIISAIIPDNEMPRTEDGRVVDILLNPLGVISRMNLGQIYELAHDSPAEIDPMEVNKKPIKTVTLVDPVTGKKLKNVLAGNQYIMKLEHMVTEKSSARYIDGYDSDLQPAKGGEEGAKTLDALTLYAMLAHGARANLEEMATLKAEKNTDAWHIFETGGSLPPPKPTFAFMKFLGLLKAAGVNVEQKGVFFKPMPLIDRHTEQVSSGEVKIPKLLVAGKLSEEKGGLFDPILTGGLKGEKWTHLELAEPVLNPMFEKPVANLMNITQTKLRNIIAGKDTFEGKTGIDAIKSFLKKIDIDRKIEQLKSSITEDMSLEELDNINRQIRFLTNLKRNNIKPEELIITKIPILPPIMRPIYPKAGENRVSPFNLLYRDIALINDSLKSLTDLPFDAKKEIYANLYNSVKALYGLGDPISTYYSERKPQGILPYIAGPAPKEGFFQSKLLSRKQDVVGRSTIIPDNTLTIDEIGIPESMAWQLFSPFVMREMVGAGYSALEAAKAVAEREENARKILHSVAEKRFVLANRAPSLYKFNIMAFKPRIVSGEAIRVNPLVVSAFGGDFDGDTFTIHTPIKQEALTEAAGMLPSRVFLNPRNSAFMFMPSMEAIVGLNILSKRKKTLSPKKYSTLSEAERDIYQNKLDPDEEIILAGRRTTAGQEMINSILPQKYRDYNREITKKTLESLLKQIFKEDPTNGAKIVNELNNLGTKWAYLSGFSIRPEDIKPLEFKIPRGANVNEVLKKIDETLLKHTDNSLVKMIVSGARGNPEQLRQILVGPVVLQDHMERVYPHIFDKSYAEGLPAWQYWLAIAPARKGIIDKKVSVSEPGELSKEMIALMNDYTVTEEDCKTKQGRELPLEDAADFALVDDIRVDHTVILKRNMFLTPERIAVLEKHKIKTVKVRTPLTCEARVGVCVMCAGLNEYGEKYRIGQYIGIISAHALSEPATQLALKSVHVGLGLNIGGFKKLQYLMEAPKTSFLRTPLAEVDGVVTAVGKDPAGNHVVRVQSPDGSDREYFSRLDPVVKKGDKVSKGDPLFAGIPHIEDVYKTKGLHGLQDYLYRSLKDFYTEQKIRAHPRHFMLVAKAMTNYGVVTNPKNSPFAPGDRIRLSYIRSGKIYVPVEEAAGETLAEDISHVDPAYKPGYELTEKDTLKLAEAGYATIAVKSDPPEVEPVVKGLEGLALMKTDWLERMTFRHLKSTIQEAAIRGWTSNLKGYSPLPAYIYGPAIKTHGEKK